MLRKIVGLQRYGITKKRIKVMRASECVLFT
jgi:hypothetical protein